MKEQSLPRPDRPLSSRMTTLIRFLIVGATGIAVNELVYVGLVERLAVWFVIAAIISTEASTTWNFLGNELWAFSGRKFIGPAWVRYLAYAAMNNALLVLRVPMLWLLTDIAGLTPAWSNLISLGVLFFMRFLVSDGWVWRRKAASPFSEESDGARGAAPFRYDIGGLLRLDSESELPELAYFRTRETTPPDIRIRIRRVGSVPVRKIRLRRSGNVITYREHLGILGADFNLKLGQPIEVEASPLLALSRHVLYTNVIEALLRFVMVSKGYVLLHSAGMEVDGEATLLSAQTDTGKTSTVINMIRERHWGFISDDMAIIDPAGKVKTFPKPMTLSYHTMTRAVDASTLGPKQRLQLQVQSRIHSKSGRSVGKGLGTLNLPIMSINSVVQLVVPPPKYHITALLPARITREAPIANVFLMERGEPVEEKVSLEAAVDQLLDNTDDAYGFPPFATLAPHLVIDGLDYPSLRARERELLTAALQQVNIWRLRVRGHEWGELLPSLIQGWRDERLPEGLTSAAAGVGQDALLGDPLSARLQTKHEPVGIPIETSDREPVGIPIEPDVLAVSRSEAMADALAAAMASSGDPAEPSVAGNPAFAPVPAESWPTDSVAFASASRPESYDSRSGSRDSDRFDGPNGPGSGGIGGFGGGGLGGFGGGSGFGGEPGTPGTAPPLGGAADAIAIPRIISRVPYGVSERWPRSLDFSLAQRRLAWRLRAGARYWAGLAVLLAVGTAIRLWAIGAVGFNNDEAVYAGQGASLAGDPTYLPLFAIFRAHPLLVQFLNSIPFRLLGVNDVTPRLISVAFGVGGIAASYAAGSLLYGRRAGLIAAAVMTLMPYHVIVTRQALLDGPETTLYVLSIYQLARFARGGQPAWFYGAAFTTGLTVLAKETAILIVPVAIAFLLLAPEIRVTLRQQIIAFGLFLIAVSPYPAAILIGKGTNAAQSFILWEILRQPNHTWTFYAEVLPAAMGPLVFLLGLGAFLYVLRRGDWQDRLILCWIVVPVAFFEIWPVKGFQYLLPIAPAVAILVGLMFDRLLVWAAARPSEPDTSVQPAATQPASVQLPARLSDRIASRVTGRLATRSVQALMLVTMLSIGLPAANAVASPSISGSLAGTGGLPGGREAGLWIRDNVPNGATFLTEGPTMANIVEFYGQRQAYGLSVSPNPIRRNPAYDAINNPDRALQLNRIQYIATDIWSAQRSPFFDSLLRKYIGRYHGTSVYRQAADVSDASGNISNRVVIEIFEVRP